MKSKIYATILLVSVSLLSSLTVIADAPFYSLKGKVYDESTGEPLIEATVVIVNKADQKIYQTKTGLDGSYFLKNVPEGSYEITIEYIGYNDYKSSLQLTGNNKTYVSKNIRLTIKSQQLQGVTISTQQNRETASFARASEKKADNLINIISARSIQLSPDITVGNVLQRVPGVSIIKNSSGDGEHGVIRGMSDRYNYTTVNGIRIPSPSDKSRSIPMDIFPADMLSRLEVVKSLTPDMEGDAIGGVTNLVLRDAPDHFVFDFNASTGISGFFTKQSFIGFDHSSIPFRSPRQAHGGNYDPVPADFSVAFLNYKTVKYPVNGNFNFTLGNKISNKLAFLTAFTYQHSYKGSSSLFYPPSGQPQPVPASNTPVFAPIQVRTYYNLQNRMGVHGELNYNLSSRNKFKFYTAYFRLDQFQHRNIEEGLGAYLHQSGEDITHDRSIFERQIIYTTNLQGTNQITDKLSTDWSLVYSDAESKVPNWIDQAYLHNLTYDSTGKLTGVDDVLQNLPFYWTNSREVDHSVYLNLHYALLDNLTLSAGGLFRYKTKNNSFESYTLYSGQQHFTNINDATFPRIWTMDTADGLNYSAVQKILAYYGELKWNAPKWEILGGLRVEHTDQTYNSELSITLPGKSGHYIYTDFLPSINIKYKLTPQKDLRLSYFSGISRPEYFEYIPVDKPGDYFDETGNPNLKHTQSYNTDLRFEQSFNGEDYFMIGTFYKYIIDPIEYGFVQLGTSSGYYEPQNFGNATNYGLEVTFTKHWRNFGVSGNYSYTKSSITTTKRIFAKDASGNSIVYDTLQTRPLQGQSDHIANLSLLYKNFKGGINAQLSWVYTGKRINYLSPYYNLDYWQKGTSQLDFSAAVKLSKHFTLFAKATNLLNNPIVVELHNNAGGYYANNRNYPDQTDPNAIIVEKDVFDRDYTIGIRFKQ